MNLRSWLVAGLAVWSCSPVVRAGDPVVIFPSGASVPENMLRVELRFATPLHAPLAMDHVRLLDDAGRTIEGAFLELPLPDADGKSVTLLLHPGRVKSGVGLNLLLGRALKAGSPVTLVVDDPATGKPFSKTWQVVEEDLSAPEPATWSLSRVIDGSRRPLTVSLDAPVSSTTAGLMAIRGPDGKPVEGLAALMDHETSWYFMPRRPWRAGRYALMVHPDLEDPSGNRACMPFERKGASHTACESGTVTWFDVTTRVAPARSIK